MKFIQNVGGSYNSSSFIVPSFPPILVLPPYLGVISTPYFFSVFSISLFIIFFLTWCWASTTLFFSSYRAIISPSISLKALISPISANSFKDFSTIYLLSMPFSLRISYLASSWTFYPYFIISDLVACSTSTWSILYLLSFIRPWYVMRSTGRISILSKSSRNSNLRTIGLRYLDSDFFALVWTGLSISFSAKRLAGSYFGSISSISLLLRSSISSDSRCFRFSMREILFFWSERKVIFRLFENEFIEISEIKLF